MNDSTSPSPFPIPEETTVILNDTTASSSPASTPPTNPTPQSPPPTKPKRKIGPIVATLFGVLLLVGAVAAGIRLVGQQQLINQQASGLPEGQDSGCCSGDSQCVSWYGAGSTCSNANGACASGNQCRGSSGCTPTHQCTNSDCGVPNGCGQTCNGGCQGSCGNGVCETNNNENPTTCSQDCGTTSQDPNWTYAGNCIQVNSGTVTLQRFTGPSCPTTQNSSGTQPVGVGTYCPTPSQGSCEQVDVVGSDQGVCSCDTSTPPPVPTPTPTTPPITAACTNVKAYNTTWTLLTATQLSALRAGDRVRFTVTGTTTGAFDKAKFTVNGSAKPETTLKRPQSSDFYYEYTIPEGTTTFTVSAQLHQAELNQWF